MRQSFLVDRIVDCMSESGFEFDDYEDSLITPDDLKAEAQKVSTAPWEGMASSEIIANYGLGITTTMLAVEYSRFDLKTGTLSLASRMSDASEQLAADTETDAEMAGIVSEALFGEGGCIDRANALSRQEFPELVFQDEFKEQLSSAIDTDPRLVAAKDELTSCAKEAGFEYNTNTESELWAEGNAIRDRLDSFMLSGNDPPADALEEMHRLQENEIDLAVVVDRCKKAVNLAAIEEEVTRDQEEKLVASEERVRQLIADYEKQDQ